MRIEFLKLLHASVDWGCIPNKVFPDSNSASSSSTTILFLSSAIGITLFIYGLRRISSSATDRWNIAANESLCIHHIVNTRSRQPASYSTHHQHATANSTYQSIFPLIKNEILVSELQIGLARMKSNYNRSRNLLLSIVTVNAFLVDVFDSNRLNRSDL